METVKCIIDRQSYRNFKPDAIDRKIITELVNIAANVPSWRNCQPTRYTYVDEPALKARVVSALPDYNQGSVKSAAGLFVVSSLRKRSAYNRDGTPSSTYGDGYQFYDCGSAAQTLCLAAWDKGLATIMLGGFDPKAIASLLAIPETEDVIILIPIGYPGEAAPRVAKKDANALLRFA